MSLLEIADRYKGRKGEKKVEDLAWREKPVRERLSHSLVHGIDQFVVEDTEEARQAFARPVDFSGRVGMALNPTPQTLERELQAVQGTSPVRQIRIYTSKGL